MMRLFILVLLPGILSGQETHPFHAESGMGVRLEKKEFFLEPTAEWVNSKLRLSFEGGVIVKRIDFFGGIFPLRTGVNIPVWREVKVACVVERKQLLGGFSLPIKKGEIVFLANQRTVKTVFLIRIEK